jgi:hypothetical protein
VSRAVAWFSAGAASAVAAKMSKPDIIAYCETGAEHEDNARFMADCEKWFGETVLRLRSTKYADTWDVFEKTKYLAGIAGARCTGELKVKPRLAFQRPDDVHIFGYTADSSDQTRAANLVEHWPDMSCRFPLIDAGLTKANCLAIIQNAGIEPPLTYALGFPNANCLPCVKATSASYWALVRREFPDRFERMVELSRRLNVRLCRINGERTFIDEIPIDHSVTEAIAPECDMLCALVEEDMGAGS